MVRSLSLLVGVLVLLVAAAPVQAAVGTGETVEDADTVRNVDVEPTRTNETTATEPGSQNSTVEADAERVRLVITFVNDSARRAADLETADLGVTVTGGREVDFMPVLFATAPQSSKEPLRKRTDVETVVIDRKITTPDPVPITQPSNAGSVQSQTTPWGISKIGARNAARRTRASAQEEVTVAILDAGVDYDHPDIDDNVEWGASYVNGIEREGLAAADDRAGHGTAVAGIIAAEDNNQGVVGVAPNAELYSIQVLDQFGFGYYSWWVQGMDSALKGPDDTLGTEDDADILSMSIGGPYSQPNLENAVERADNHAIVVAAAGNSGDGDVTTNEINYPAKYDESLAVAATARNDSTTTFSSEGREVDVAAPGYQVETTKVYGGTRRFGGTSAATPYVSGVLALMMAKDLEDGQRDQTDAELVQRLRGTAVDIEATGNDYEAGDGRIAANKALTANSAPTADAGTDQRVTAQSLVQLDASGSTDADGDTLSYAWQQTAGPTVSLTQPGTSRPTFAAPSVSSKTTLTFEVTVADGNGGSVTDSVDVVVDPNMNSPDPGRYDVDGDGTLELADLNAVIDAYNKGTTIDGKPVTASDVTEAISIYNS